MTTTMSTPPAGVPAAAVPGPFSDPRVGRPPRLGPVSLQKLEGKQKEDLLLQQLEAQALVTRLLLDQIANTTKLSSQHTENAQAHLASAAKALRFAPN